jgi:hypothetical protein
MPTCNDCGEFLGEAYFSKNQLRKGWRRRCENCVGGCSRARARSRSPDYCYSSYSSWSSDEQQLDVLADEYGWYKVYINQPETCSYKRNDARINFYRKDGIAGQFTVGSYLDHPYQGKTQLFRRDVDIHGAREIFNNPRVHTGSGYHRTSQQQTAERTISCPLCNRTKKYKDIVGLASHVESGSCPGCLGQDNARNQVYRQVSQVAPGFISNVPMIGYGDWNDVTAPESGAYFCRKCNRTFNTVSALMGHTKHKHPESGYQQLQLGF